MGMIKEKHSDPGLVAATLWAGIIGAVLIEISIAPKGRVGVAGKNSSFNQRFEALREVFLDGFLEERPGKKGARRRRK